MEQRTIITPVFIWRFADAEFDEARWELRVAGQLVDLEPRPLEVLLQLLRHGGEVVTKEDLLDAVYGHRHLSDGALAQAIRRLRRALNDEQQCVIATVHRVGYKFTAVVKRTEITGQRRPPLSLKVGEPVPRREHWKLLRPLGSGEVEVWLAEHEKTRDQRVFKFCGDGPRLPTLKREVTLFRVLKETLNERDDLVRLIDWNFDESPYFIEYEYGGMNLIEWSGSLGGLGQVTLQRRVDLLADAAEAVAAIHSADVLHKDLKPANLLVYEDAGGVWRPRLTDFGSGRMLEPDRLAALRITQLGFTRQQPSTDESPSGTPLYLAPELIEGQMPTVRSDVYALGVMLYQLSVGDLRKPMTSGWQDDIEDELLRADIALAAHGNPLKRLGSAQELVARLRDLPQRRQALIRERENTAAQRARAADKPTRRAWPGAVAALFIIALSAGLWQLRHESGIRTQAGGTEAIRSSIAVLPFENLSRETDSAYFAEGVQEEILTQLAKIGTLKVISRTSSQIYEAKPRDLRTVARQLGVANLLEGSVQRAAGGVRVTVQLIEAKGGSHLWAETYDRPSNDVFGVESEIAKAIADALQAKLTVGEQHALTTKVSRDPEAYDAYLRALSISNRRNGEPADTESALKALETSLQLDPDFAPAWALLAKTCAALYFNQRNESANRVRAREALDNALRLAPDSAETRVAQGYYHYWVERDYDAAGRIFQQVRLTWPNNVEAVIALARMTRPQGRWEDGARYYEDAIALDPRNLDLVISAGRMRLWSKQYPEALKHADHALDIAPDDVDAIGFKASIYQALGDLDRAQAVLALLPQQPGDYRTVNLLAAQAELRRNYPLAVALWQTLLAKPDSSRPFDRDEAEKNLGHALMLNGDRDAATAVLIKVRERYRTALEQRPGDQRLLGAMALVCADLGDKAAALKHIESAFRLDAVTKDARMTAYVESIRAVVAARISDKDLALSSLRRLLTPAYAASEVMVGQMRLDPEWDGLRDDPRFQQLLADVRQP